MCTATNNNGVDIILLSGVSILASSGMSLYCLCLWYSLIVIVSLFEPSLIRWFHPHLTRHAADCILIDNAPEGSYLLRPVEDSGHYALSVK